MGKDVIVIKAYCRENKRTKQKTFNIKTPDSDKFETGKEYVLEVKEAD